MADKTYRVVGNKTVADAVANNNEILETGYTQEEAVLAAVEYQRVHRYVAAWIEEEESEGSPAPLPAPAPEPRIVRGVESDRTGQRYTVVRCDGWAI